MRFGPPLRGLLGAIVAVSGLAAPAADGRAAGRPRIAVLVSHEGQAYADTLAGFRQHLARRGDDPVYDVHPLNGDRNAAARAVESVRRDGASVVLALGSLATQSALAIDVGAPVVSGLVLGADAIARRPGVTGVSLDLPHEVQFDWLRRILPEHRRVGVLFNPAENRAKVDAAARAARAAGLVLVARPVESPREIPEALAALLRQVDVLWGLVDPVVLSPQTATAILLASHRERIPFVGPSAAWVKAGALYSLDWDYADIGEQCADIARRMLQGTPASAIPASTPRRLSYTLNLRAARQLGVSIADAVVQGAGQVLE